MTLLRCIFVAILVRSSLATKSADQDQENLRIHLGEIRAIVDETQNPCDNFPKYACGHFRNVSVGENYPNDRVYLSEIAADLNRLKDIKLQATQKAKDFLESCQKHQSPKNLLKKVDVFKNPADFKLAKTLGILKASGIDTIIRTHINVLDDKKYRLVIALDKDLFLSSVFNENKIKRNLQVLEVPSGERADAEKKINEFIKKGKSILTQSKDSPIVGKDVHALKNFDWDEYLAELKKFPKLSHATIEYLIEDVVSLQKIIDLANETDLKALRLVTALEFMAEVIDTNCDTVVDYFRLPIFSEFYRIYFTATDKAFNLDVIKAFEKSHGMIKSKVDGHNQGVLTRVKEKRKIIESMNMILDAHHIDEDYKDVIIEKDNFFQNYLYLAKHTIYKYLSKSRAKDELAEEYLMNLLNPVNRMKPVFYHFASQGLFLWQMFFRENRPKYSYDDLRDCLDEQQDKYKLYEFNALDYFDYVDQFAAMKQTYQDYKRYWDHEYDSGHKLEAVFNEFHLTSDKAFFLNLAQRECAHVNDGQNIPFRVMLNLEEASKAFSCSVGTQLNIAEKCKAW